MINRNYPRPASDCRRCCGSAPDIVQPDGRRHAFAVVCPTCGKRTAAYRAWWIAEQEWNCNNTTLAAPQKKTIAKTRQPEQLTFLG